MLMVASTNASGGPRAFTVDAPPRPVPQEQLSAVDGEVFEWPEDPAARVTTTLRRSNIGRTSTVSNTSSDAQPTTPQHTRRTMKRLALALIATLALLGAACGNGDDNPALQGGAPSTAHNDADVAFAQDMIPHHEQAVEMSDMALKQAGSAKVKDLATRIKAAQGPEIAQMRGWLQDWNQSVSGEHGGGHGGAAAGMMSDAEMRQLEQASGAAFDKAFLQGMIRHHEGAVTMAKKEQAKGQFPDAKALASRIVETQEAEIAEMKGLLQA